MANAAPGKSQRRPQGGGSQGRPRPGNGSGASRGPSQRPKAPPMEVRLRILDGPAAGTEYAIAGAVVRLGRGDENDIPLEDNNASRVHAEVVCDKAGRYLVRDLGSRNGIYVNRKKVPQAALANGDRITIGGTSVQFVMGASDGSDAAGAPHEGDGGTLRRWLVVAVIVGVMIFIVAIISSHGGGAGGNGRTTTVANNPNVVPNNPGEVSLTNLLQSNPTPKAGVEVGRNTNTRTNQVPVPVPSLPKPAEGQIQSIMNEGDRAYAGSQLPDARAFYSRAVALDPSCEGCRNKLNKVDAEIKKEIESSLNAGISYYNTDRFAEAKRMFEKVKLLDPDPKALNNGNATNYINLINAKMAENSR